MLEIGNPVCMLFRAGSMLHARSGWIVSISSTIAFSMSKGAEFGADFDEVHLNRPIGQQQRRRV